MELKQDLSRQPDLRRAISQTQSASWIIPSASVESHLPETGHVHSSAWRTEDPAWGGTRGGPAWGDTAAALIHPASRSSARCCSRGERCWRAHRRTLLPMELQGSWGTAGGTYTTRRAASKGSVSDKGWWCSQHSTTSQPSSHSSIDHKDFLHSSNTKLLLPGSQNQPRVTDH